MKHWAKWARWAWMLPVAELLVAGLVAGPLAVQLMRKPPHLYRTTNDKIILDMSDPAVRRWFDHGSRFPSHFEDVYYLNIPAILIEIPISLPTSWPDSYRPSWAWPLGLDGFRAITWPIWALPFWFFAGRGVDTLTKRGHVTAGETFLMGFLALAMLLFAAADLFAGSDRSIHQPYEQWALLPIAMWIAFGIICQIAWWRQRRDRTRAAVTARPG